MPHLQEQHLKLRENRVKKSDFHKVENELNHFRRLEETDWDQINRTKTEFWATFYRSKTEVEVLLRIAEQSNIQVDEIKEKHAQILVEHRQLEESLKEDRRFERVKITAVQREQRELVEEIKHIRRTIRTSKDKKAADLKVFQDELEEAEREMEMRQTHMEHYQREIRNLQRKVEREKQAAKDRVEMERLEKMR